MTVFWPVQYMVDIQVDLVMLVSDLSYFFYICHINIYSIDWRGRDKTTLNYEWTLEFTAWISYQEGACDQTCSGKARSQTEFKAFAGGRMTNAGVTQLSKKTSIRVLRAGVISIEVRSGNSCPNYNSLLREQGAILYLLFW